MNRKNIKSRHKLIHGLMIMVMLMPLLFSVIQSYVAPKNVAAAPPETINLHITKYLYNQRVYSDLISAGTLNNGGTEITDDLPAGVKREGNVPFGMYKISSTEVTNQAWAVLVKFVNDFSASKDSDGSNKATGANQSQGKAITLTATELATPLRPGNPANNPSVGMLLRRIYSGYNSGQYGALFPDTTSEINVNSPQNKYYPVTTYGFNRIIAYLRYSLSAMVSNEPNVSLFSYPTGTVFNSNSNEPVWPLTGVDTGEIVWNIKNEGRYILIEGDAENSALQRQTAKPMILDLPLTTLDDAKNDIYIYPKNEIPTQSAQFRKVDGMRAPVLANQVNAETGVYTDGDPDAQPDDEGYDVTSGATLDAGEYFPLRGAKFALFEFKPDARITSGSAMQSEADYAATVATEWAKIGSNPQSTADDTQNPGGYIVNGIPTRQISNINDEGIKVDGGLFTSNRQGMVNSPELPYGKYFFMEIDVPEKDSEGNTSDIDYSTNMFPVYFEVNEKNISNLSGAPGNADRHQVPLHAVSNSAYTNSSIEEWEFPNYKQAEMNKTLTMVDGTADSNGAIGDGRGLQLSTGGKFQYTLSTKLNNPATLLGSYIAFYDLFTKKANTPDENGDFEYESYHIDGIGAATNKPKSFIDIRDIFDIDTGEHNAYDFYEYTNASAGSALVESNTQTTRINGGVPSTLIVRGKDGSALGYFGAAGQEDIGEHLGAFADVGNIGWYDSDGSEGENLGETWAEYGTPTGTQLYWAINLVNMRNAIVAGLDLSGDDNLFDLVNGLDLEFTLTPKENAFNNLQVQALHNIGQFEWNEQSDHPWIESENDAYVGGRIFEKVDQDGKALNTLQLVKPVRASYADGEEGDTAFESALTTYNNKLNTYKTTNSQGQFIITRDTLVNEGSTVAKTEYLQYDKVNDMLTGWTTNKTNATHFDTDETGKFKIFGLIPNATIPNGSNVPVLSDHTYSSSRYRYFIDEPTALTLGTGEDAIQYRPLGSQIAFLVAPRDTATPAADSSTIIRTALGETRAVNNRMVPFPITGGIGTALIVILGLIVAYIVYRYFKKRQAEFAEEAIEG